MVKAFLLQTADFWFFDRKLINSVSILSDRTVAIDLRGFGDSDKPEGRFEYTMDKLVLDLKAAIEYLGN